jgi:hypothetical protein
MRAFGARGCVSPEQLKRTNTFLAVCRKAKRDKERALIAALSNQDIQKIMARIVIESAVARTSVSREDLKRAGIPEHRIDNNFDAAMRLARMTEPKLDAMLAQPCAA